MKQYLLLYMILMSLLIHPMNSEYPPCYCAQDLEQYDPHILAEIFNKPLAAFMAKSFLQCDEVLVPETDTESVNEQCGNQWRYTIACPHCTYHRERNPSELKKMIASFRKHVQKNHPTSPYRLKTYTESLIKKIEIIAHS